jgi:hypothetical protein
MLNVNILPPRLGKKPFHKVSGHEKLNFKALRIGPVGIDIYGSRFHSSSKMLKFLAFANAAALPPSDIIILTWFQPTAVSAFILFSADSYRISCLTQSLFKSRSMVVRKQESFMQPMSLYDVYQARILFVY